MDRITVRRWLERHLHIRDGEMMQLVLPCTLNQRPTGAVIMGNLTHPDETSSILKTRAYRSRIQACLPEGSDFKSLMTCYLTDEISPDEVVRGFQEGVWVAVKQYLAGQYGVGGTTNSGHGVKNMLGRYPVFESMQRHRIPLLFHLEVVEEDVDEFDREIVALERHLVPLLKAMPELPVVVEHITDGRVAEFVAETSCNVYATVTIQGLVLNRNAMFWGGMNPVHYCKPVPKREEHRRKVRGYVTSGHKRFGAGTDSAPHDGAAKARPCGCAAGIFTANNAVEHYTTVFDEDAALEHLGGFLSENFVGVYGMEPSSETMTLERAPTKVPEMVGPVHVFRGGQTLNWRIVP